jgi:hypothetical protein
MIAPDTVPLESGPKPGFAPCAICNKIGVTAWLYHPPKSVKNPEGFDRVHEGCVKEKK